MNMRRQNSQPTNPHLLTLKNNICLSNLELNELVHNHQKFVGTVHKLNNEAKAKITLDRPKEALIYLSEAQKILEYGASCGKNIDRNLIVCVLHNEACCHQKLWELDKCSNYIEALIFNLNMHLNSEECRQGGESDGQNQREEMEFNGKSINNRIQLSKYYLQFCAINSQLSNHQEALDASKRAITIIKALFKQLEEFEKSKIKEKWEDVIPESFKEEHEEKMQVIRGISYLKDVPLIEERVNYITTAKHYLKQWNNKKMQQNNESIKEGLRNFSIGNVMQIKPISFEENRESTLDNENILELVLEERYEGNPVKVETYQSILNKVLFLTIGYFTTATELRLMAADKYKTDLERNKSVQYRQSEIYHLITIIISSIYIPFDTLYMRHLITSFSKNYNNELSVQKINTSSVGILIDDLFLPGNQGKLKSQNQFFEMEYTNSIQLKQSKSSEQRSKEFGEKVKVNEKNKTSLSSRKQKTLSGQKIMKMKRTKSEMMLKLKSCLTPNNGDEEKKPNKRSKKEKTKILQPKQRKKIKSLNKEGKKKVKKEEKEMTSKDEYFKKVNLKNGKKQGQKLEQMKRISLHSGKKHYRSTINNVRTSTSEARWEEKKQRKKNIEKYYF